MHKWQYLTNECNWSCKHSGNRLRHKKYVIKEKNKRITNQLKKKKKTQQYQLAVKDVAFKFIKMPEMHQKLIFLIKIA